MVNTVHTAIVQNFLTKCQPVGGESGGVLTANLCIVSIVEHLCSCRQVIGEDHYNIREEDTNFCGDHIAEHY